MRGAGSRSEPLGPQQRVNEINQQAGRYGRGKRIVKDHDPFSPLEALAGVGVADRKREEAERERQHQNVHHGVLLLRLTKAPRPSAHFGKASCDTSMADQPNHSVHRRNSAFNCHDARMFSRRPDTQNYMNPIKEPPKPQVPIASGKLNSDCIPLCCDNYS